MFINLNLNPTHRLCWLQKGMRWLQPQLLRAYVNLNPAHRLCCMDLPAVLDSILWKFHPKLGWLQPQLLRAC